MKVWCALIVGLCSITASGQDAPGDGGKLDRFLQEFGKKRETITALTADFAQTSVIDGELWSEEPDLGTVVYAKPKRILFTYEKTGQQFLIDTLQFYDYTPENEQLTIQHLEDKPEVEALFLAFSEDFTEIREAYNLGFFDTGDSTLGLELTPKDTSGGEGTYFVRARLWLRPDDFLPTRVEATITEDSINTYYLSEYELHDVLPPDRLQIAVPSGTTVVQGNGAEILTESRRFPIEAAGTPHTTAAPLPPPVPPAAAAPSE